MRTAPRCRMVKRRKRVDRQVKAQLRSSSGRSSKLIKDREGIEAVVEVAGAGRLVLYVDSEGGYSLRGYPEGAEAPSRTLLAAGVMGSEGIVANCAGQAPGGGIEDEPG
jgi:hypothetical protein